MALGRPRALRPRIHGSVSFYENVSSRGRGSAWQLPLWHGSFRTRRSAGMTQKIRNLAELIAQHAGHVTVACDTEYLDTHTLTVQFAARLADGRVAVQLYRSPLIPAPPPTFDLLRY